MYVEREERSEEKDDVAGTVVIGVADSLEMVMRRARSEASAVKAWKAERSSVDAGVWSIGAFEGARGCSLFT